MADRPDFPALRQAFRFGSFDLVEELAGWSGTDPRRGSTQKFLKRAGAKVEDGERDQRRLEAQLVFTGDDCARRFVAFRNYVDENPTALLVHPIEGKWIAFCTGPQHDVDLSQAVDLIRVRVSFEESELDVANTSDTPDVPTAQQLASAQSTTCQQSVATFMAAVARASTQAESALASVDAAAAQIASVTAPVSYMLSVANTALGASSRVLGALAAIETTSEALANAVESYVESTADLFDGSDVTAGSATAATALLGQVQTAADALEDALQAAAASPAGAADAVGAVEETLSACLVVDEAVRAARPPTITVTVTERVDLVTFCVRRYGADDALARASDVLALNRIKNPAAIPAGTQLLVPSR